MLDRPLTPAVAVVPLMQPLLLLLLQAEVPTLWEDSDPKYITDSSEVCIAAVQFYRYHSVPLCFVAVCHTSAM
jgi:hypothetical protein